MSSNKKVNLKKVILSAAIILLTLAGVLVYVLSWQGDTKDIEAVADSFKPLDGWQEAEREVVTPKIICLMGNCPEVYRSWKYKKSVDYDDIKKFAGYDELLDVDDRCKNNNLNVCEFSGKRNGYQYRIHVSRRDNVTNVGLNVRKGGFVDNVN